MLQSHTTEVQQVRTRISSPLARVLSKRLAWFSIAVCLLLFVAMVGVVEKNGSVDAASAKHSVSSPKHVHAPSAPKHAPSRHSVSFPGRHMPTMNVSPSSVSFSLSLAQPQVVTRALTITNNGSRTLYWQATVTTPSGTAWVSVPSKGTVARDGTTVQVMLTVKPSKQLTVGTYTAQLVLTGTDQGKVIVANSPQTINLTLNVTQ